MAYNKEEHARLVNLAAELKEKREGAAATTRDLVAGSDGWDDAKSAEHSRCERAIATYDREIKEINSAISVMESSKPKTDGEIKALTAAPLNRWMRKGKDELSADERIDQQNMLESFGSDANSPAPKFVIPFDTSKLDGQSRQPLPNGNGRLQSPQDAVTTPSTLSNTIVIGIDQDYIDDLSDYGGANMEFFTTIHTTHGNKMEFLLDSDTTVADGPDTNLAAVQGEKAMTGMSVMPLEVQLYNSGYADISRFMFEDVGFNPDAWVRRTIMRRVGKKLEAQAFGGTGATGNPRGFYTAADVSTNEYTTKDSNAMKYEDLVGIEHSIDRALLKGMESGLHGWSNQPGQTCFVTSWPLLQNFKTLRDMNGMPLYMNGFQQHEIMSVNGYPIKVAYGFTATTLADNAKVAVFGNFRNLVQRYAGAGLMIEQFYDSGTSLTNSLRYLGKVRWGCGLIGPHTGSPTDATMKSKSLKVLKIKP